MSVEVVKVQTDEYRITVKKDDPELTREYAVAAELSAIASAGSEQVASEKAAQTELDAASALASKQASEASSTTSTQQATASGISAAASDVAKGLSEAAKEIAIQEAGKSVTSAGQSAGSAADAEAAKNLILNKAEVNVTTAGNILLADGTLFKSVPQVEFLRNKDAFNKSGLYAQNNLGYLTHWDSFERANTSNGIITTSDSGQEYSFVDSGIRISNNEISSPSRAFFGFPIFPISATLNSFAKGGSFIAGFVIRENSDNYIFCEFRGSQLVFTKVIDGISTQLSAISFTSGFSGFSIKDFQLNYFVGGNSIDFITFSTAAGNSGGFFRFTFTNILLEFSPNSIGFLNNFKTKSITIRQGI